MNKKDGRSFRKHDAMKAPSSVWPVLQKEVQSLIGQKLYFKYGVERVAVISPLFKKEFAEKKIMRNQEG